MKYQQPYGIPDVNAPYINGDPSIGRAGSIPPAAAFEYHQRELVSLISASGFFPTDADLTQVVKSVQSQRVNAGIATNTAAGTQNDIVVAYNPGITQYTLGLPIRVIIAQDNTGPTRVNAGAGFVAVVRANGAQLDAGDLKAAMCAEFMFDGTKFQVTNFRGVSSDTTNNNTFLTNIPYCADTSLNPSMITANFTPAIATLVDGNFYAVKLNNTVLGPTTIQVNTIIGAKQVLAFDGKPLMIGDAIKDEILLMCWKAGATAFQLMNPLPPRERFTALVFPEINGNNNTLPLGTGSNTVIVPSGCNFIWRGCIRINTDDFSAAQRTLATVGSKTYYVRWHAPGVGDASDIGAWPNGRFVIKDIADVSYNPGGISDTAAAASVFDSTYDDMLIARVVTSAGNAATIINLANKARLFAAYTSGGSYPVGPPNNFGYAATDYFNLNWARTPPVYSVRAGFIGVNGGSAYGASAINAGWALTPSCQSRYQVQASNWTSVIDRFTLAGYGNATLYYSISVEV
jgi:hypothetical protein